jgi:tetrahydromethanopterin S-methyltransferase subunit D
MLTTATRAPATVDRATVVAVMVAVEDCNAIFESIAKGGVIEQFTDTGEKRIPSK